ncbi:hypothetical protein SRHO_G00264420 [Serrasalmus rhombeus]
MGPTTVDNSYPSLTVQHRDRPGSSVCQVGFSIRPFHIFNPSTGLQVKKARGKVTLPLICMKNDPLPDAGHDTGGDEGSVWRGLSPHTAAHLEREIKVEGCAGAGWGLVAQQCQCRAEERRRFSNTISD